MYSRTTESPVLLIGSAHVVDLDASLRAELGERTLDAIAIELDAERAEALLHERTGPAPRRGRLPIFVRLWGILQRRLGEELGGGVAGAEMRTAAAISNERAVPLVLIDDPIRQTLQRLLQSIGPKERISLLFGAVLGLVVPARWVERQLDAYSEAPDRFMEEVRASYPGVARVLLDERNEHMAERIAQLRARGYGRIAAVVGDAHLPGLSDALRRRAIPVETIDLARLRRSGGAGDAASAP